MSGEDRFAGRAAGYAAYRPTYPVALVDYLVGLTPGRGLAWDAGCGSGQLSVLLADGFERVIATDASAEQIAAAAHHSRVEYRCAPAEASGLPDAVADLAVAAQAAHWFDLPAYYAEVRRVARPGAIVALVTYGNMSVDDGVDPLIRRFYAQVLGRYWAPARRHVEGGYRSLPFPFDECAAPALAINARWALPHLLGYVETWSAVRALAQAEGRAPLAALARDLARVWGPEATVRAVRWPLSLRVGRVARQPGGRYHPSTS